MPTGDSLTVFVAFASGSLASMIGALTAPAGWRRKFLGWLTVVLLAASLTWLLPTADSPVAQLARTIGFAGVHSGAFVMVGTVLIVAIMLGGRQPVTNAKPDLADDEGLEEESPPRFAAPKYELTKWEPDISLADGTIYVGSESRWAVDHPRSSISAVLNEVRNSLHAGRLTGWARAHPDDSAEYQIAKGPWGSSDIILDKSYAFFRAQSVAAHDVRLSKKELETAYPPAD